MNTVTIFMVYIDFIIYINYTTLFLFIFLFLTSYLFNNLIVIITVKYKMIVIKLNQFVYEIKDIQFELKNILQFNMFYLFKETLKINNNLFKAYD